MMAWSLATLILVALTLGCRPAGEDPDRGSTMTVLVNGDAAAQMRLYDLKYMLFLPLAQQDGVETYPALANSWEHASDLRVWTFHLREDVQWHDGVPVTADDIAFSLELFDHSDVLFQARAHGLDSTMVLDDHTIVFFMREPAYYPPVPGWTVYFPKHLLEHLDPAEFYEWDFWMRPVGNGPYRFVRRLPRTMVEFEANPDFYAGEPPIERVVAKLSSVNPVVELTSGAADAASDLTPADVLKLEADPRFVSYYQNDWSEVYLVYWNHRHPLLADARVRQALEHAIDRQELARVVNLPEEVPSVGGLGNDGGLDPERRRQWDRVPAFDPLRAERLLEEVGWVDHDADGVREKAGQEARFTLLAPRGGSLAAEAMALVLQDQWRRAGVRVDIRPMGMTLVREALRSGNFDAGIIWENQDAHTILWTWFGGPANPQSGETGDEPVQFGYHDAEAANLLEVVLATPDPAGQDTLYARFNEILRRDSPVMILFPGVYRYVAHRRIRGFRQGSAWLTRPHDLWIEEAQR